MSLHTWLIPAWDRLVGLGARLPHALLLVGPAGLGKRDLAEAFAARLLCQRPREDGHACGECAACALRLSGNHPDLLRLVPASELQDEAEAGGADEGSTSKAKSSQIVIDQVRALQRTLAVTGHQSSRRAVVVDPADAMNPFTANALLKLLEEPPQGCVFLLVCSAPRRLLPTIRSRCQQWRFSRPDGAALVAWADGLDRHGRALLAVGGGMPLAATRSAERGIGPLLERFVRDLASLPGADPLRTAGQWDNWLKSKEAAAAGFGMVQLADWMLRWVTDLAMLRLGGRVRYFPAEESTLSALAAGSSLAGVTNCYNEFIRIRRVAQHPLNARLMIEDMLLRYVRAVSGARR
ncbi:MAG: DNA polymerase III subunit delta' [Rhodocyclaceae bacterium]